MDKFWENVERNNSKIIPYAIVVLMIIIVVELLLKDMAEKYHLLIEIIDYLVIVVFAIDLGFLAKKAKSTKFFFKHYWLDILAVLPIDLLLKFVTRFYTFFVSAERVGLGQNILHESLEVSKATARVERIGKVARGVRVGARVIRVVSKTRDIRFKRRRLEHMRVS